MLVPLVLDYHSEHLRVVEQFAWIQQHRHELVIAAHSLVETYSTITRLPPRLRATADVATGSIRALRSRYDAEIASLGAARYLGLLESAPARGVVGGRIYDVLIAATAVHARAEAILTFNARDFAGLEPTLQVLVPGQ